MASTTNRLGLHKPADDGSEFIDVAIDLNQNLDKIDAAIGFVPTTSSTPPGSPYPGMARQDTDTGRAWYRDGANSTWIQVLNSAGSFDANIVLTSGKKIGIGTTPGTAQLDISAPSDSGSVVDAKVSGDTNDRISVTWDGVFFGPGNAVQDAGFYRSGANEISFQGNTVFDNDVEVTGATTVEDLTVGGTLSLPNGFTGNLEVTGQLSGTGIGIPNFILTPGDTENNTATLLNHPDFVFAAEANSTYLVELFLHYSSWNTADLKTNWTIPTGASGNKWSLGMSGSGTARDNTTMVTSVLAANTAQPYGGFGDSGWTGALEQVVVIVGATPGNIQFQFAKNSTSDGAAPPAKVRNTSLLRYTKVG